MDDLSLQQLLVTNFGLSPSGYAGSRGDTGYVGSGGLGYTGSAGIGYSGSAGAGFAGPRITTIGYPGDNTAADTAGGETITLTGANFAAGAQVIINGNAASIVSVVNSTTITFTAPPNPTGSYLLYVVNQDGATTLAVPGLQYSGTPAWSTAAGSLGNVGKQASFTANLVATGDAPISYSVYSGALPSGIALTANTGVLSGTTPNVSVSTTYNFTVRATDLQRQDTDRAFSITISPYAGPSTLEYLVVAGGGSGFYGGGGAGGLLTGTTSVTGEIQYTVTVGAGASAGVGSDSVFGDNLVVTKGGGGGSSSPASNGGSGGGSGQMVGYGTIGRGVYPGSSYISAPRQGYDGAYGQDGVNAFTAGGGGGGAGGAGQTGGGSNGGTGGPGLSYSISGTTTFYAGGGGGGTNRNPGSGGSGGAGGGGSGYGDGGGQQFTPGVANTGGGGGGTTGGHGAGGSGIIIVRYADTFAAATSTTGSPTVTVAGGYRVYRFTSSGSITF
jgi:hypothetical protein